MAILRSLVFSCVAIVATSACSVPPDHVAAWKEDIDYYLRAGEANHIDLYHSVSRDEVAAKAQSLIERLPELSENEVIVELMRIARLFGDGHTAASFWGRDFVRLPFGFDDYRLGYAGEYRIVEASPAHKDLLGQALVSIEGRPIDEVIAQLEAITPYVENPYSQAVRSRQFVANADVLNGLGIVEDVAQVEITVEDSQAVRSTITVASLLDSAYRDGEKLSASPASRVYVGQQVLTQSEALWMSADAGDDTAYIYFGAYPSYKAMDSFARKVQGYLDDKQSRRLIIDLRDNSGGDFFTGLVLASRVLLADSLDWQDGVFVLIGNKVFSASMSNAAHYRQILNARLIGSPTGANPNGYQETHAERLPNSKLAVTFSKRNYRFQDEPSEGIQPDVAVETSWADFVAGRDRVIDWVLMAEY